MAKKLWGGRFSKKTNPLVEEFTKSLHYDFRLAKYDLTGSLLHVEILKKSGYLTAKEAAALKKGLKSIYDRFANKPCSWDIRGTEDIHTFIQNELLKESGSAALKLQTARSRNDQVAFATKMYCKDHLEKTIKVISGLISAIKALSRKQGALIIPGFTHLQHAQPVYLKSYLSAYEEMLIRDSKRLGFIDQNLKPTLGAGALAGTPIAASKYAGFATKNSMDTVSDRDFVIEIISALSIIAMHLSRLSEDLIIWSTKEFDFIEIDEAFCTGSSLMPQKKNPDVLELIRGYTGRLNGNLISILTMMKGLPLTYNRDMQLDKEPLFNSFEIISSELRVLSDLVKTLKFNKNKIAESLKNESLYATDLVYYLVDKKVPFKQAHTIIGELVKYSISSGKQIKELSDSKLKEFSEFLKKEKIIALFDPKKSVESKISIKR